MNKGMIFILNFSVNPNFNTIVSFYEIGQRYILGATHLYIFRVFVGFGTHSLSPQINQSTKIFSFKCKCCNTLRTPFFISIILFVYTCQTFPS